MFQCMLEPMTTLHMIGFLSFYMDPRKPQNTHLKSYFRYILPKVPYLVDKLMIMRVCDIIFGKLWMWQLCVLHISFWTRL